MGKHKWTLGSRIEITADMYDSPAYRELTRNGMLALQRFLQKRKWSILRKKRAYQNTNIKFTFVEARDHLGIKSKGGWQKVLKQLIENGFIKIDHQGGIAGDNDRSVYSLVDHWEKYGQSDFVKKEKQRVLWKGRDVRAYMKLKIGTPQCT